MTAAPAATATRTAERTTPAFLTRTALAIVLGLATVKGLSVFAEPDLWWQLRTGDRLRDGVGLVAPDPSAAFAERDYTATQWGPELVASWVHSWAGVGGVLWLRCAAILVMVAVVYVACRRTAGRLVSTVTAGLVLLAAGGGLNPRPQLVSFVLFALVLHGWLGVVSDRRPRWWMVPLFWVWAASHALWMFGLAVGALVVGADMVQRRGWTRDETRRVGLLWALCLATVMATPLGPALLAAPFQVASKAVTVADEWRPTPLNNVFAWAAVLELGLCVWLWVRSPRRPVRDRPLWQPALLVFATFCTLWMWRLVPIGAISAAPLLAQALQHRISGRREDLTRRELRGLSTAVGALLAVAALWSATPAAGSAARYPGDVRTIDAALDRLPPRTVVLDDFGFSGWLLWRHPDLVPVADLRGEIYSRAHLTAYESALSAEPGWRRFVEGTGARGAVVSRKSAIADALQERAGWRVVARSEEFVLLVPSG